MKRLLCLAGVGAIYLLLQFNTLLYAQYYYTNGQQIPLGIDSTMVSIKFENTVSQNDQLLLLAQIERVEQVLVDQETIDGFTVCSLEESGGYAGFIDSLETVEGIESAEPYYVYNGTVPCPVGETFFATFDPLLSLAEIDSINESYHVGIVEKIYGTESIYLLKKLPASSDRLLEIANTYYQRPDVFLSHPNFGIKLELHSYKLYDFYHFRQDHIKRVIGDFNVRSVWDFAGLARPVNVAVIDDGLSPHEDLPASRILPGYDFADHDSDPSPVELEDAHGTACAGLIGASHTTDSAYEGVWSPWNGMISMNGNADIMPVRVFSDGGSSYDVIVNALSFAYENGAEVISNSYGSAFSPNLEVVDSLIKQNFIYGRNGLGTPVIFSSGNGAPYYPGTVGYPARIPYTLAVGAIDFDDERYWYSQYGPELDVVAPSGETCLQGDVWSLDVMDNSGYNPYVEDICGESVSWNCPNFQSNDIDYDCHFGGTSAAAPIVAGIASLLIARDSTLTAQEVYDVIKYSAETNLESGQITVPHTELGYGRADAYRAMLAIVRGDVNNDGSVNIGDIVYMVQYIYQSGPEPKPDVRVGDANCDGNINVGDTVFLIDYVFKGGPPPSLCYEYDY